MKQRNLAPEIVDLNHGAKGLWIGNKNAKDVVVYYHGSSSFCPATRYSFNTEETNRFVQVVALFFPQ